MDFEGERVVPVEAWEETCDDGWCRPKTQPDPSPFGAALAFLCAVGSTRALDALPGVVVDTGAQATTDDAPAGPVASALPILDGGSPDEAEEELVPVVVKAHRATSTRGGVVHHVIAERARAMAAAEARRAGGNSGDSWGNAESTKVRKKDS